MFDIVGMNRSTDRFEHVYDDEDDLGWWPLTDGEKEEADELGLDEANYRIYRKYKDAELYDELEEE